MKENNSVKNRFICPLTFHIFKERCFVGVSLALWKRLYKNQWDISETSNPKLNKYTIKNKLNLQ